MMEALLATGFGILIGIMSGLHFAQTMTATNASFAGLGCGCLAATLGIIVVDL
jgi:hypothetical protein